MCGICGILDPAGPSRDDLRRMADTLRHRGPEDEGYLVDGAMGLGHRRLSIIDVPGGKQPISNEAGDVSVVFNGEVYNHVELRRRLEARGHVFRTDTDTEVLVHLYEDHGEELAPHLRGMFAFAIWDARRRRLVLGRDRLGQKPLYWTERGGRFAFASEPKAILALPGVEAALDAQAFHGYLTLRFVPSPRSMFEGIHALPPAHVMVVEDGGRRSDRYWEPAYLPKWTDPPDVLETRLEELLREAVESHLVADVALGAFLSGGIDSSLVTALMSGAGEGSFPTFSIGSEAPDFNELPLAREVAAQFGTDHHEEVARPDLVTLLPEMVHHLDMPGDPIAACQYHAARLAARHVKVALGGDGGDEVFGGYDRYRGFGLVDGYARVPEVVRRRLISPLLGALGESFTYKGLLSKARWLQTLSFYEAGERYAEATAYFRFDRDRLDALYGPTLRGELQGIDPRQPVIDAFGAADADEALDRMLHADLTTRLPEHLLVLLDRMTMAHSLEGRSPLVDHEVVEFAGRLPTDLKIRPGRLKHLQRRVAERHLPESVAGAPKRGFMFPIAYWLQGPLSGAAQRFLLDDSRFVERGIVDAGAVGTLLDEHARGRVDHHHRIWMLLNLEVWHRLFLEGEAVEAVAGELALRLPPAAPAAASA